MKIGIVNYNIGNIGSVRSAFRFFKLDVRFVQTPQELENVDVIVLAGVGNFITAVRRLKALKMWDKIDKEVTVKKKPVIGICLGMQLFSDLSYEGGRTKGFGWIEGQVVKMDGKDLRIPHIGWNRVNTSGKGIFNGIQNNYFYFMHSYHFVPKNKNLICGVTDYGDLKIVSAVKKDNIIGVQFHPEKSQSGGLRLLKNMIKEINC